MNVPSSASKIRFPRVVALFGPDGAGKSTQTELLAGVLRSRGFEVKKAWVRSTHTIAYLMWMLFYKLNLCEDRSGILKKMRTGFAVSYLSEAEYGAVSPITMSPPILKGRLSKFIWSVVELAGIVPVVILQVHIPLLVGRVVVAERFVVDSIASIAYFLGEEGFVNSWQASLLLRLVPRGTVFVYVDAPYDTILSRRGEVAGPREYTDFHRKMYSYLAPRVMAFRVDTSMYSVSETHEMIVDFVSKYH